MTSSIAKAHRLLSPRIAYLIGTRDLGGMPNVIPVSNVTSVSTDPQHVLLAIYKQWRTYETLLNTEGFALSVPLVEHLQGVWKLGAKYSSYPAASPHEKLVASRLSFDYDECSHGPVLVDGAGWMECQVIERADFNGDHGLIIGQVHRVWFNPEFLNADGVPHAD